MLGQLSLGVLWRSADNIRFVCGNCEHRSILLPSNLPAALTFEQCAGLHLCSNCHQLSGESRLEFLSEDPAQNTAH
jgi:hypothetical protein